MLSLPVRRGRGELIELRSENLITLGQCDPGLLAAGPDMHCRPNPRSIVEGAGTHPNHPAPRRAADPGAAVRAHQAGADPPAVCSSLQTSRLDSAETKTSLGQDDPHREGTAG